MNIPKRSAEFSGLKKPRFSRKAQMSTFVKIVAITISALVFLLVLWPALSGLIKGAGKMGECNWNLFLAALTKQVTLGFVTIPVGCQAEYITVDTDMLAKSHRLANKRITKYHSLAPPAESSYVGIATAATPSEYYLEAAKSFHLSGTRPSLDSLNEWALDSIIGKKMQQCWDKVWHGKLDFFAQGFTEESVCVICTVLRFSEDMPVALKNQDITSLHDWMSVEPYYKTTYWEYIAEGQTIRPEESIYNYETRRPQAIVYVHAKDGFWEGLLVGGVSGAAAGATAGAYAGAVAGTMIPIVGNVVGGVAGFIVGGLGGLGTGALTGWWLDGPKDSKQLFIMPDEGTGVICEYPIA